MSRSKGWKVGLLTSFLLVLVLCLPADADSVPSLLARKSQPNRGRYICPMELQPLTQTLLRDLPGYINRLYLRTVGQRADTPMSYALIASQPELTPLPIESAEYSPPQDENLHQVFFTVLERQYSTQSSTALQHYHWLFLARTQTGWQVALMFSRLGSYPADRTKVLTPPRDSSQSLTAQAIRTWLRDCEAGAVKP